MGAEALKDQYVCAFDMGLGHVLKPYVNQRITVNSEL